MTFTPSKGGSTSLAAVSASLDSPRYNRFMSIAVFFIRVLEVMFFIGLAGSAIVVLISFFEDAKELFGED